MKKSYFCLLFFLFLCLGCLKIEKISDTPRVEFRKFLVLDSSAFYPANPEIYKYLGFFTFYFEDGNGDVGTVEGSTDRNLFFNVSEKIGGKYVPITDEKILAAFSYQIPDMETAGQNKTLSGTITVKMILRSLKGKSIKFGFYIFDKERNKSNLATSPELSVIPNFDTDKIKNTNF